LLSSIARFRFAYRSHPKPETSRSSMKNQRTANVPKLGCLTVGVQRTGFWRRRFQLEYEDTWGYLRRLREMVERYGIPLSLYRDRHGTFQRNDQHGTEEEQLSGRQTPTQLGRALEELGIQQIAALTPQAKGRIERVWRVFQTA
jgi:hypothetical protein